MKQTKNNLKIMEMEDYILRVSQEENNQNYSINADFIRKIS